MRAPQAPSSAKWLVALGISAIILAVYWKVTSNLFINYDDNLYVTANPQVQAGLSWNSVVWAFSTKHTGNWIPLTWLSHMLDCQLYGLSPAGHHLTSLLIHIAAATLLFLLFHRLTEDIWSSALMTAVFAVHPVNVESVAWVAERKNLLCMLMWLATMWAYVRYASRPDWKRYLVVVIAFILALMSKPMAVTLPFVLLLLDYWPLRRLRLPQSTPGATSAPAATSQQHQPYAGVSASRIVLEKIPLLLLAVGDGLITLRAQQESGSVRAIQAFPIALRIENALVSYPEYIGKLFWPARLAVFYPYPKTRPPAWEIASAVALLLGLSVFVFSKARRFRYAGVGWLWYLVTLIPVIGLIQVGGQSMADRYQYIPVLGILILVCWGLSDLTRGHRSARNLVIASALAGILILAVITRRQVGYWTDSESLFLHTQSVTDNNYVAYNNLGEAVAGKGRTDEAAAWFAQAVQADPDYAAAQENLGMALIQQGNLEDGITHATRATQLDPKSYDALNKLGAVLAKKGQLDDAAALLNRAIEINPKFAPALANMAIVLEQQGKLDESAASFESAIQNAGNLEMAVQFHYRLGNLLAKKGDAGQAAQQYREALRLKPDYLPASEALRKLPSDRR